MSSESSSHMPPHAPMIELPDGLTLQRENGVATVTLARENPRNPLSHAIMSGLRDVARWLKTDIETHAVIVTGDPVFSAGADLKDPDMRTDHMPRLQQRQALLLGPDMCAAWEALEQVTICAIEGYCLGGGMALAVACDWRVCAEDVQLRLPEIPLGINMSWQANPRITALIGLSRAKQVIILGENIAATQAEQWGLVDFVTAKGQSLAKAQELAAKVVALPPLPVRMSKQAVNAHAYALNYASSFMDREQYALLTGSDENKDAIKAFINKSKSSDN
ncbi:MAG: enoyl-CoA hydratase/isomerase family protein [Parvibaculales bacterium]